MAKTLGKEKELDEEARKPFAALAEKDKERYQKMKDYKPLDKIWLRTPQAAEEEGSQGRQEEAEGQERAQESHGLVHVLHAGDAPEAAGGEPGVKLTGVAQRCGALWKELSEEDKAPYIELAATDKERRKGDGDLRPAAGAMPVEKKVSKRDQARKEKEKKERKRKRAVEQERRSGKTR